MSKPSATNALSDDMPSEYRLQALEAWEQPRRLKGTCRSVARRQTEDGLCAVLELVSASGRARRVVFALPDHDHKAALKGLRSFVGCEVSLDADRPDGEWRSDAASISSPPKPKYTLREQLRDEMRRALSGPRVPGKRPVRSIRRRSLFD